MKKVFFNHGTRLITQELNSFNQMWLAQLCKTRFIEEITVFKMFIWGSISSDIRSEICFMATHKRFPNVYPMIHSPNENFEYGL